MNIKLTTDQLNRPTAAEYERIEKIPVCVILENIRSRSNVGAIFRSADAFLIDEIILCGFTAQPPHRDIHKTALGATETVPWRHFEKTSDAIADLRSRNYSVWAIEQTTASRSLDDFSFSEHAPIALVLGNEVKGIEDETLGLCDGSIEISQYGTKHSLNVSVCGGIVLHKANHQLSHSS